MTQINEPTFKPGVFYSLLLVAIVVVVMGVVMFVPEPATKTETDGDAAKKPSEVAKAPADEPTKMIDEGNRPKEARGTNTFRKSASVRPEVKPEPPKPQGWTVQEIVAKPSVYLLDKLDESGNRRRFHPAPLGERYVQVRVDMTWNGPESLSFLPVREGQEASTVQLRTGGKMYESIGQITEAANPIDPLSITTTTVSEGDTLVADLLFLVPDSATSLALLVAGQPNGSISLPETSKAEPAGLAGLWQRSSEQVVRLRSDNELIDTLSNGRSGLLRFSDSPLTPEQLTVPGTDITGNSLISLRGTNHARVTVMLGDTSIETTIRALDDGASILLYFDQDQSSALLYERVR